MRNLKESLKVVDYRDDVCIMNITSQTERANMTFTITADITGAASFPSRFDATLEEATSLFNDTAASMGITEESDWTLTLWHENEIVEEASFVSQATLDATARRIAKNEAMKAKMANYYNLSDVLARGDEASARSAK